MMETQRVVTRTVELLAWQYRGEDEMDQLPAWVRPHVSYLDGIILMLKLPRGGALEGGEYQVPTGMWITQEIGGHLGVCTHKGFHRYYQSLTEDTHAVELRLHAGPLSHWNDTIVERASVAFHDAFSAQPGWQPWPNQPEHHKNATRLAMIKALTAAITTGAN